MGGLNFLSQLQDARLPTTIQDYLTKTQGLLQRGNYMKIVPISYQLY